MTGIWRKKQIFGHRKITRATHIDYNPLAHFYQKRINRKIYLKKNIVHGGKNHNSLKLKQDNNIYPFIHIAKGIKR